MAYDFGNLSPADFEDLVRDLIGLEFGMRFEAFAAGPDGGIDGRHAKGPTATILQAKHYARSSCSSLKSQVKRERPSIAKLAPARYVLATSCPLAPKNKFELAGLIGPALLSEADIFGPGDLNALLRKYPEIVKSHIKLWLSDAAVLERVVRSAKIVDHKNQNPRIIEWMTDTARIGDSDAATYPAAFLYALDHPGQLWDISGSPQLWLIRETKSI